MVDFIVAIPARHDSSRLPGKPLREIAGKTMIEHVYQRAKESGATEIFVATDDHRIFTHCRSQGMNVELTSRCHQSGTERIAELAGKKQWQDDSIIVNVQGDEPFIPPENIQAVVENLAANPSAVVATLCEKIQDPAQLFDTNVVKVVRDINDMALYFSRAPVPWSRDTFGSSGGSVPEGQAYYRHIGLYAYRAGYLREISKAMPSAIEQTESLEQLRVLHYGQSIHTGLTPMPSPAGIDTEQDLENARLSL